MRVFPFRKAPWNRRTIEKEAAEWLALREARAWTPAEHATFADWRSRSREHAALFDELEKAWRTFDVLAAYPHSADRAADPDLLLAGRPFLSPIPRRLIAVGTLAASVALAATVWIAGSDIRSTPGSVVAVESGHSIRLTDGSVVELNIGAEIVEAFGATERRVVLRGGEAHFSVAHNPALPFVVEAGTAAVRAVGTAFNVRMADDQVEVLVTEGKVEVALDPLRSREDTLLDGGTGQVADTTHAPVPLSAGQRTVLEVEPISGRLAAVVVDSPAAPEIDRMLSWQTGRLIFDSTPLRQAIEQFNARSGGPRLVLGDNPVGDVLISGRIRAENVDHFVEVLVTGFGVEADRNNERAIVLRSRN